MLGRQERWQEDLFVAAPSRGEKGKKGDLLLFEGKKGERGKRRHSAFRRLSKVNSEVRVHEKQNVPFFSFSTRLSRPHIRQ